MKIFIPLPVLLSAVVLLSGCSPPGTPQPPTAAPPPPANVSCNELALYLDPALGSGGECLSVPESSSSDIPMDVFIYPEHTELTIQGYPLTRTQFPPQISVYPVERFSELLPEVVPGRVADLQTLLAGGAASSPERPFLPPLPMRQSFVNQETVLAFNGGQGLRYLTDYNEASHPVSNRTLFYTFQGLTADGRYWVAVTLPVSSPLLPEQVDFPPPPDGGSLESWFENYRVYVSGVQAALEAQAPDSFSPTLTSLDNLVSSLTINP